MGVVGVKIGVLGGTFDPVHNGHLAIVETARVRCGLAQVVFVPALRPWQKADRDLAPIEHRLAMLRLAIEGCPYFRLSEVDINRPGPTYTIDTIADLRKEISAPSDFYFILGWDSLESLPGWKQTSLLIQLCYLVAVPRPRYPRPDLARLDVKLPGVSRRVVLLDQPWVDISASDIRDRVAHSLSIRVMVPDPVGRYIEEHKLYRKALRSV